MSEWHRLKRERFSRCWRRAALAFLLLIIEPAYHFAVRRDLHHDAGAGDLERLARCRSADRHRVDDHYRAAAAASGRELAIGFGGTRADRVLIAALTALQPLLQDLGNLNLLIFFVGIVAAAVFAGVPIAFSFGLATFGYLALTTTTPTLVVIGRMDEGMSHLILLAVPLFVFWGCSSR